MPGDLKMINIYEKHKERFQSSYEKIRLAYQHKETGEPPIIIVDVNSYLSGENPEAIPGDYYDNFNSMAEFQMKKIMIVKMQELFEDRLTIMVCDFAPLNIEQYYRGELIDCLKFKGIVLAPFVIPGFALDDGKYETVSRDRDIVAQQIFKTLKRINKKVY